MRFRGLTEAAAVILASVVLACAFTFPLILKFDRAARLDSNDGRFSVYVVAWVAHALTTDPRQLYNANFFYPHTNTLAFSEGEFVEGAIGAPVWALTKNPYTTHNVGFLLSFVVSTTGTYYLIRYLTASRHAAAVAAVLFAYCPYIFARTAHIQLMMIGGLPLCLLAFHRLVDRTTMARAVVLGLVMWLQGLACAYFGIFAGGLVGFGSLVMAITRDRWREPRYWIALAVAAVVCVGLTAPFFLPYLALQKEAGFARSLDDARTYSANTGAWLASAAWAHRWWLDAIRPFSEVLFPGVMTLVLGVAGAWMGLRRQRWRTAAADTPSHRFDRGVVVFYVLAAAIAFWVTLGPKAGLYTVLYNTLPVFSFLRAPARTGIVVTLCLVALAGLALARLVESRRARGLVTAGLFVLASAELFQAPLGFREAPPVSPAYQELARLPRAPVAVFPFWARGIDFHGHAEYLLASTAHWQPLINGYSDHIPQDFRDNAAILRHFPNPESFTVLERLGARYLVFHLNLYAGTSRDEIVGKLAEYGNYLRPLSKVDDTWLFEIVGWPR